MTNWAITHYSVPIMSELLIEIKEFCGRFHMSESTRGKKSVNDGKLVGRLKSGGRCWPETEQKVRDFMNSYEPTEKHD